jgi:DNA repair photolyase
VFYSPVSAVPTPTTSYAPRRGARSNRTGRFETIVVEADEESSQEPETEARGSGGSEGLGGWPDDSLSPPRPVTQVLIDHARTIISRNTSPDILFDRSVNPYRGCEHGCVYCFARPTHAWLGLSPGLDFETKLFAKVDAAELLRAELQKKSYRPSTLALGANTDPYQPIEKRMRITRSILELLQSCDHPTMITTKSDLVLRDLDLLVPMAARRLMAVSISLATLDVDLARRMDPRAPIPARRLAAARELAAAGIPVTILTSPMIPGLNDHELEDLLAAAADVGAQSAGYSLLRLPQELEELFAEWTQEHYPLRREKIFSHLRSAHEGSAYRSEFGIRMRGSGPYADLIESRFRAGVARHGLDRRAPDLDCGLFRPPVEYDPQMSLF